MSVEVTPRGTRGVTFPRMPGGLGRFFNDFMFWLYRNRRFQGGRVLSLMTVGARSGQPRRTTIMYFADGPNAWLIVASKGGAATHPDWFFNLAKHPDQVNVRIGTRTVRVTPETLTGEERSNAWQRVIAESPTFAGYEIKTDRQIPVVRLTAISS